MDVLCPGISADACGNYHVLHLPPCEILAKPAFGEDGRRYSARGPLGVQSVDRSWIDAELLEQ